VNQLSADRFSIAYSPQQTKSIGQIIQGLVLIWELLTAQEMIGHLEYL